MPLHCPGSSLGPSTLHQPTRKSAMPRYRCAMLDLTRRIGYENARMKAGQPWQTTIGLDLEGLTLGVLGLGKLGARTARIAKAFGMKVLAWSQNLTAERCQEAGVDYASKDDLF